MNLHIEELDKKDIDKVIDLFCLVWNEPKHLVTEKTLWAFANTFSKVLVFKNEDEEIIAVRGGFKWPLTNDGKNLDCYQFHGTCVHPNYRRMSLFTKLNKAFLKASHAEQADLIYNVSVKASKLGYEKLGWHYLKGFHRLTKFHTSNLIRKANRSDMLLVETPKEEIPEFFFEARRAQFKGLISTNYSEEFLQWRLNNKEQNYQIHSSINAFIIYKTRIVSNRKELIIGEIFLQNKNYQLFRDAFRSLLKIEKPDISFTYIFSSHPFYKYYLRYLYLPNPLNYNLNFGVKLISDKIEISDMKWGISFLDIDTF